MKILSLTNTTLDPALGSGKTVLAWSNGLRNLGHKVDVMPPENFYQAWPKNKGRTVKMRLDASRIYATILSGQYDLIEFYGAEFSLLIAQLARISRKKRPLLVAHTNGLELLASSSSNATRRQPHKLRPTNMLAFFLEKLIAKSDNIAFSRVDAFAAICEADMKFLTKQGLQPIERCAVVEPGIDELYLSAPWQRKKKQWLVHFASWCPRKDPDTTVRVTTDLLCRIPDLELHVIGASDSKQEIFSSFSDSLRSRIFIYPRLSQEEVVEVLSQAKVFLFPSLYEGFGMATTEAMACGCAVVVTPTGFGETIRDGVDGFVCDFHDSAKMTARCLALFSSEELRVGVAMAARKRVCDLSWVVQVGKLEAKYNHWLHTL